MNYRRSKPAPGLNIFAICRRVLHALKALTQPIAVKAPKQNRNPETNAYMNSVARLIARRLKRLTYLACDARSGERGLAGAHHAKPSLDLFRVRTLLLNGNQALFRRHWSRLGQNAASQTQQKNHRDCCFHRPASLTPVLTILLQPSSAHT